MSDMTIRQISEVVGMHPESLRRIARSGRLAGIYKLGGSWRLSPERLGELRNLAKEQEHDHVNT